METEKFKLKKRTIKYSCGCEIDIFDFENCLPNSVCDKHGKPIISDENMTDEL
jgi:hypothetical protein